MDQLKVSQLVSLGSRLESKVSEPGTPAFSATPPATLTHAHIHTHIVKTQPPASVWGGLGRWVNPLCSRPLLGAGAAVL